MGTIEDYSSGRILESIAKAVRFFDAPEESLTDKAQAIRIEKKIREFEAKVIPFSEASRCIRQAKTIALGERVCRALNPGSEATESVFLDELAEAMIGAGKASAVKAEEAENSLKIHPGHPLIISMVSGKYQEICPSCMQDCVYWRAEKRGMHCLKRK
ncbi:MAG: hypothetical protein HGA99_01155 [Chlorobiaceae bacterium]|nr:hypothetical protein [Chlorobiaceae bacterium]